MTSSFTSILENTIGAPDPQELASQLSHGIYNQDGKAHHQLPDNVSPLNKIDTTIPHLSEEC